MAKLELGEIKPMWVWGAFIQGIPGHHWLQEHTFLPIWRSLEHYKWHDKKLPEIDKKVYMKPEIAKIVGVDNHGYKLVGVHLPKIKYQSPMSFLPGCEPEEIEFIFETKRGRKLLSVNNCRINKNLSEHLLSEEECFKEHKRWHFEPIWPSLWKDKEASLTLIEKGRTIAKIKLYYDSEGKPAPRVRSYYIANRVISCENKQKTLDNITGGAGYIFCKEDKTALRYLLS